MSVLCGLVGAVACGGDLPRPAYVGQLTESLVTVPYPPPPARVEMVSQKPANGAVWIDGEWTWQGRRYAWRKGRWVLPPPRARFSPWTMVRGEDGTVYYASGVWLDEQKQLVADPAPLTAITTTVGQVVDPQGEQEETGRTVHESQEGSDAGPTDAGQTKDPRD